MTHSEKLEQARGGAAFGPPLRRGLLRLTGKHRLPFLHRISTQRLKLEPGESAYTSFLDVKAHVVAEGTVLAREDDLVVDVAADAAEALAAYLRRYVIMDDVKVQPMADELRVLPVFGERAIAIARQTAGSAPSFETARHGPAARDFILGPEDSQRVRAALADAGAAELGDGDLEALRVWAGVPRWGAELDVDRLVLETGIVRDAVAFDKGCYIGQEVVARGTFRGQVQRGLVQLEVPAGTPPTTPLVEDGREVGVVTSVAETPEGTLALGYLRRAFWTEGQRLKIAGGEAVVRRALVQERDEPAAKRGGLSSRPPAAR
ncbi:MAG TPA: folate-binding protein [Anaeromyxobacteraceae bacterium]|nr:folate-binding protein [Anaeromyxobacteraceae bacterium]